MTTGGAGFEDVGLRAVIQNVSGFRASAKTIQGDMDNIIKKVSSVGKSAGQLGPQMASSMRNVARAVGTAVSAFGQLGFAVFGIQQLRMAIGQLSGVLTSAAAQWEGWELTMSVMMRSTDLAKAKLEELLDFAQKTPFTAPGIVQAAKRMLAYGFASEELIPIMSAVSDAAAGVGEEAFPAITRALGQMRARTKVTAQEMNQLTEAGIPAWDLLAKAIGKPISELQELVSAGAVPANEAIQVLLAGMQERFAGLSEAQSKTFSGMLANISDWAFRAQLAVQEVAFEDIKAEMKTLMESLNTPEMKARLKDIGQVVGGIVGWVIQGIRGISSVVGTIAPILGAAATGAWTALEPIVSGIGAIAGLLQNNLGTALQVSTAAVTTWASVMTYSAAFAIGQWISSLGQATVETVKFGAFMAQYAAVGFAEYAASIARSTTALVAFATRGIAQAVIAVGRLAIAVGSTAVMAFSQLTAASLRQAVPAMVTFATVSVRSVVPTMAKVAASMGAAILGYRALGAAAIASATAQVAAWTGAILPAVMGAVGAIGAALAPFAAGILAIAGVVATVAVAWSQNWGNIQGITASVLDWVGARITDFLKFLKGLPIIGAAIGWVGDAIDTAKRELPKLVTHTRDAIGGAVDEFRMGMPGIQQALFGVADAFEPIQIEAGETEQALIDGKKAAQDLIQALMSGSASGKSALSGLKKEAQGLEKALRDAQDAMRGFSQPRLVGMQAAEDEIFELEQSIKRARLAELGMGDAAKSAAKEVKDAAEDMAGGFDLLSAQQRELAQGIPVPFQKAMWEIERAQSGVDFSGIAADGGEESSERDRLERLREAKQLMYDLTYEPSLRGLRETFEELTGANQEITFRQAYLGLQESWAQAEVLRTQLEEHKVLIDGMETSLGTQQTLTQGIAETRSGQTTSETAIRDLGFEIVGEYGTQLQLAKEIKKTVENIKPPAMPSPSSLPGYLSTGMPEFAEGGTALAGGFARVGERGPETVALPTGSRVIPGGSPRPAEVSRTYGDNNFNISGAQQPIDVMARVAEEMAYLRLTEGR